MEPPPPKGQQQTLFDQALLLDESDSMFAFLDHMVSGSGPEAAAGPMLYGASGDLGDAALAGPAGDSLTWAEPMAASQPWGAPGQPFGGAPAKPVKDELDQRERSGSGSGDRSSGDTAAEPTVSRKSDTSLRSKADKLHLAREKNKEAQKAFRRRQKAKQAETETRVAELAAQLEQLQQENQSLYRRNLTLQSALVVRSAEPALPMLPRGSVESAVSTSGQACACDLSWGGAQPAWLPWSGNGSVRNMAEALVQSVVPAGARQAAAARAAAPAAGSWAPWAERGGASAAMAALVLTLGDGMERVRLTPEGARALSVDGLRAIWKELVKRTAAHLVDAAKDAHGPAAQEIEGLTREAVGLSAYLAVNNPRLINSFNLQSLTSATGPALAADSSLWSATLLSLRLTDEQKAELLSARRTYFMRAGPLLQERSTIQSRLQVVDERLAGSSVEYLQLNELSDALQRNLQSMHLAKCLFMMRAWHQVLTPIQVATFAVHTYPRFPDMIALLAVLADQAGEPSVSTLLRMQGAGDVALPGGKLTLDSPCSGSIHDVEAQPSPSPADGVSAGYSNPIPGFEDPSSSVLAPREGEGSSRGLVDCLVIATMPDPLPPALRAPGETLTRPRQQKTAAL